DGSGRRGASADYPGRVPLGVDRPGAELRHIWAAAQTGSRGGAAWAGGGNLAVAARCAGLAVAVRRGNQHHSGLLDRATSALVDGCRPGDLDSAAVLQRRCTTPALLDAELPAIHHAHTAIGIGGAVVQGALPSRSPIGVLLHWGGAGRLQLRRLEDHAQKPRR